MDPSTQRSGALSRRLSCDRTVLIADHLGDVAISGLWCCYAVPEAGLAMRRGTIFPCSRRCVA